MEVITLITAIFFGVMVLSMDLALSVGIAMFWREGSRVVPIVYALTEIAITALFIDTVVRMWIE